MWYQIVGLWVEDATGAVYTVTDTWCEGDVQKFFMQTPHHIREAQHV